jgi:ribose transport system ATP-binding protein
LNPLEAKVGYGQMVQEMTSASAPICLLKDIHKSFGPTRALAGVDLELRPGEVHGLVGENGAGKSTLMKVLSGAIRPDRGSMWIDGQPYRPHNPLDARRQGIVMVYQELALAAHLTVEANITLGQEASSWGFLSASRNRDRARQLLEQLEHGDIPLDEPVGRLRPAKRQIVEIARALMTRVRLFVLDEPTSTLGRADVDRLFALIRKLRAQGICVVYISHFLEEIEAITDRVTILRDGRTIVTAPSRELSRQAIIEQMVGRSLGEQFPQGRSTPGEIVLRVDHLGGVVLPRECSFELRRGEILGIAGIVGAGRTELIRAIFGLDPVRAGRVTVRAITTNRAHPRTRIEQGLGCVSEDRKHEGLTLDQSIVDNLTYSRLTFYRRGGILRLRSRGKAVSELLARLRVRFRHVDQPVGELSGGNQQKIALGRLLHQEADIWLLDEPTRGVDIGSKAEIYRLMREQAGKGAAILFVSSYLPELMGVCDRLAVMHQGMLSPARPIGDWTSEDVMRIATGIDS